MEEKKTNTMRLCMFYTFVLSMAIIIGVFATDWWFSRETDLLNDTLVGVLIGAPIGWMGAFITYFTADKVGNSK